jgi:hypothetical protein
MANNIRLSYNAFHRTGHGIHNLISKDGIKKTTIISDLCKKARAVCRAVRYRNPDIERENKSAQQQAWINRVIDADTNGECDDMDPIPDDKDDDEADIGAENNKNVVNSPVISAPTSVKLPVPTRWHTVLIMLESIEENKVSRIKSIFHAKV